MKKNLSYLLAALMLSMMMAVPAGAGLAETVAAPETETAAQPAAEGAADPAATLEPALQTEPAAGTEPAAQIQPAGQTGDASLAAPTTEEGMGNSSVTRQNLPAEDLSNVTVNGEGLNIEVKLTDEAPYAELDATVIGINSANVDYGMDVAMEDGVTVNAHHRGGDVGINRVKLTLFVHQNTIDTLALNLTESDMTIMDDVHVGTVSGTVNGGRLHGNNAFIGALDVETTDADVNIGSHIETIQMTATRGGVRLVSDVVPATADVTANDADVEVVVPDTPDGFMLSYEVTGGDLSTNFLADEYDRSTGELAIGSGTAPFTFHINNGSLHVNK